MEKLSDSEDLISRVLIPNKNRGLTRQVICFKRKKGRKYGPHGRF